MKDKKVLLNLVYQVRTPFYENLVYLIQGVRFNVEKVSLDLNFSVFIQISHILAHLKANSCKFCNLWYDLGGKFFQWRNQGPNILSFLAVWRRFEILLGLKKIFSWFFYQIWLKFNMLFTNFPRILGVYSHLSPLATPTLVASHNWVASLRKIRLFSMPTFFGFKIKNQKFWLLATKLTKVFFNMSHNMQILGKNWQS